MTKSLKNQIDLCTLYIENIPTNYSGEQVAQIFKAYKVRDVRVPKSENKNQGYAFVELDSEESVEKAVREFASEAREDLKLMKKSEWVTKKSDMKKLKDEMRNIKMMRETKDMMNDDEDAKAEPDAYLVKMVLAKGQEQFRSKFDLNDFVVSVCGNGISPKYIDLQKTKPQNTAILRFQNKLEQEYCVKSLLDIKWSENTNTGIKQFMTPKSKAQVIDKIDTLNSQETQAYLQIVDKERKRYSKYLQKVKQ